MRVRDLSVWSTVAAVALLVLAGCGDSGSGDVGRVVNGSGGTEGVEWLAGEPFSPLNALQVLESPAVGAVVVDTAADVDGVRRVQVRWQADGEDAVVSDQERPALMFPWAWAGADRVYVAGYVCSVPSLDDIELLDVDRVAGLRRASVAVLDPGLRSGRTGVVRARSGHPAGQQSWSGRPGGERVDCGVRRWGRAGPVRAGVVPSQPRNGGSGGALR